MIIRIAEVSAFVLIFAGSLMLGLCIPIRLIEKPTVWWLLIIALICIALGALIIQWLEKSGWKDPDNWTS